MKFVALQGKPLDDVPGSIADITGKLSNPALAAALTTQTEFSAEELAAFNFDAGSLTHKNFIHADDDTYYVQSGKYSDKGLNKYEESIFTMCRGRGAGRYHVCRTDEATKTFMLAGMCKATESASVRCCEMSAQYPTNQLIQDAHTTMCSRASERGIDVAGCHPGCVRPTPPLPGEVTSAVWSGDYKFTSSNCQKDENRQVDIDGVFHNGQEGAKCNLHFDCVNDGTNFHACVDQRCSKVSSLPL